MWYSFPPAAGKNADDRTGVGPETSRSVEMPSLSNTKIRLEPSTALSNTHRPSLEAVQRYQVVAAADPNHSPLSKVAPWLLPSTTPCRAFKHGGLREIVVGRAGSL